MNVEMKGIDKSFGTNQVLKGVDFSLRDGEIHALMGENGSGKSTLMRTLLGLKAPVGGTLSFGDGLKKNEIGYLPQQTEVQKDFPASVREIVLSGFLGRCGMRPFFTKKEKKSAEMMLERLGVSHLSSRCYRELSGGQQQRVLLARALCAARKMLFLDEPATALDSKAEAEMYTLLRQVNSEGIAVVMISHDMEPVLSDASHILLLGRSVWFGTRSDYLQEAGKDDFR